ncbi:MAG: hypothetical protein FWE40_02030 [Oscillospiraceae bacterium]|nr:hypothetical protein [Oscillospiraceae bacterium]
MQEKSQLEDVLKGYRKLAFGQGNDALKLLFMDEDVSWHELEELDVFNISEITRAKQGGNITIKFYNRFEAMRHLVEVGGLAQVPQGVKLFYDAIERSVASD